MPTNSVTAYLLMVLSLRPQLRVPGTVLAASTPAHCFEAAIAAAVIALSTRTPGYLLSDAYLHLAKRLGHGCFGCGTRSPHLMAGFFTTVAA